VRIRVLIAIAAVLVVALGLKHLVFSGPSEQEQTDKVRVKVERLAQAKDVEGLVQQAQSSDEHAASLAVAALGNVGEAARQHIERALVDHRPAVREKAATAFAKVAPRQDAAKLAIMARKDGSANVRAAAVTGLERMDALTEMDAILDAMVDMDPAVRRRASRAALRFSGVLVQYNPDASIEDCRQGAERMRKYWQANKAEAFKTLELFLKQNQASQGQ